VAHADARTTVYARRLIVARVLAGHRPGEVAKQLGINRQTVHRWVRRWRTEGAAGLFACHAGPRWRRPRSSWPPAALITPVARDRGAVEEGAAGSRPTSSPGRRRDTSRSAWSRKSAPRSPLSSELSSSSRVLRQPLRHPPREPVHQCLHGGSTGWAAVLPRDLSECRGDPKGHVTGLPANPLVSIVSCATLPRLSGRYSRNYDRRCSARKHRFAQSA